MILARRLLETLILTLLAGWTLPRALLVAAFTLAAGLLARGGLLPHELYLAAMAVVGLLLGVNLVLEWYVERTRPSRVFLANVIIYLFVIVFVVRP